MSNLSGETHSGIPVSFSDAAYADAMRRYGIKDIEEVVKRIEKPYGFPLSIGRNIPEDVSDFFRDFAIIQSENHPDYDRGVAIGSLATRIELASGQVTVEELHQRGIDPDLDQAEYELIFG